MEPQVVGQICPLERVISLLHLNTSPGCELVLCLIHHLTQNLAYSRHSGNVCGRNE